MKGRLDVAVTDLGPTQLKNIAESIRAYSLQLSVPAQARAATLVAPSAPKRRLHLTAPGLGIAALILVMTGASWFLGANRPTAVPAKA